MRVVVRGGRCEGVLPTNNTSPANRLSLTVADVQGIRFALFGFVFSIDFFASARRKFLPILSLFFVFGWEGDPQNEYRWKNGVFIIFCCTVGGRPKKQQQQQQRKVVCLTSRIALACLSRCCISFFSLFLSSSFLLSIYLLLGLLGCEQSFLSSFFLACI